MTQPASSSSGFSWLGMFILICIVIGAVFIGSAMAQPRTLPYTPPVPSPIIQPPVPVVHVTGCQCQHCLQTVVVPQPCCPQPVIPVVVYPPQPIYLAEVDGFETSGQLRCYNSHSTKMGGSRQYAVGTEGVMNAQLLHERALNTRSRDFVVANDTLRALTTPPKEVVRTVTKTVYLTAPAPPVTLVPYYTVVGPTVILDAYGHRWHYANYGWR